MLFEELPFAVVIEGVLEMLSETRQMALDRYRQMNLQSNNQSFNIIDQDRIKQQQIPSHMRAAKSSGTAVLTINSSNAVAISSNDGRSPKANRKRINAIIRDETGRCTWIWCPTAIKRY
jgi:hypothetical protein